MDTIEPLETFVLDEAAIANFVKLQRTFNGWKQDMLAAEAGVSLATVSRVERGQKVRPAQLRKLARALGKPEDEFVRMRVRPTPEEAAANFVEMFAWTEERVAVAVAPFRTELQLRATLATFSLLLVSDLDDDAADDVAELRQWLDLASFVQAERDGVIGSKPDRDFRVRRLWRDVLDCVERLERAHAAVVLTGTYAAEPLAGGEPIKIAVVAIRSRRRNPAASTITTLWADAKVNEQQMIADYFEGLG
ncbi:MAG: helix-turn-helix transcriptional regulator [Hyphomicrobiales bacterium]|nr:helix-turn-helix transcriptional regulator [Hyphomicrobiales bacterium]